MARANNRHVVPGASGGFDVVAPGSRRASARLSTQADAIRRATEIVGTNGGGEVVVHRPNGQIRDSNTIGKPDPFPPRG